MGSFGQRGECPECGRIIAITGGLLNRHKDIDGDGEPCEGGRGAPKEGFSPENLKTIEEARMKRSHEAWERQERAVKERGL